MTRPPPGGVGARTYRRSLGTRVLSAVAALLFVAAAASGLWTAGAGAAGLALAALAGLSLANLVSAFWDRVTLGEDGIEYRNALLARLGVPPRRIAWEEVEEVREHRRPAREGDGGAPRAVFLIPRAGRRIVLDSLEKFDEVRSTVRARCGQ